MLSDAGVLSEAGVFSDGCGVSDAGVLSGAGVFSDGCGDCPPPGPPPGPALPVLASMLMGSARSSLLWADHGVIRSLPKGDETEPDKDDETKSDKDDVVFIARVILITKKGNPVLKKFESTSGSEEGINVCNPSD